MPTAKPRVAVTLSQSAYEVLSRLSRARGVSRSSVLAELFEAAVPAMERVADVIETAKAAPKHVLQRFAGAIDAGDKDAERSFATSLGQLDLLVHGLRNGKPWDADIGGGEEAPAGSPRRRRAPETPVPVTRGSGMKGAQPRKPRDSSKPQSNQRRKRKGRR